MVRRHNARRPKLAQYANVTLVVPANTWSSLRHRSGRRDKAVSQQAASLGLPFNVPLTSPVNCPMNGDRISKSPVVTSMNVKTGALGAATLLRVNASASAGVMFIHSTRDNSNLQLVKAALPAAVIWQKFH